jgi:hypothetical protein
MRLAQIATMAVAGWIVPHAETDGVGEEDVKGAVPSGVEVDGMVARMGLLLVLEVGGMVARMGLLLVLEVGGMVARMKVLLVLGVDGMVARMEMEVVLLVLGAHVMIIRGRGRLIEDF